LNDDYGELFRDAYALLHGGHDDEAADAPPRTAGEAIEAYLSRTRVEALGLMRKLLLAAEPPEGLSQIHRLVTDLLSNAMQADEALAEQVKAYQCGQFHESVAHSERLQELVMESQQLDRELISALRGLPPDLSAAIEVEIPEA
jgi:hypothetical protein